jgi:transglutaminase-like putative cysteine protease
LPFSYPANLRRVLAPFRQKEAGPPLEIPRWEFPRRGALQSTVTVLVELNERLHECVGYERREEGPALPPAETLRLGRGACRDVALLLATILRQHGLAARLTSGYLREAETESRRAEGSLHAWTEVYLPGAGWVGMDATNGIFSNHNFIAAAVGISPADVTPIDGSFYPRPATAPQMTSQLQLVSL